MFGNSNQDRRSEIRRPANRRALLVGAALEVLCRITDESKGGLKLTLDRGIEIPGRVIVVEVKEALAVDIDIRWTRGREAGGRRISETSLRGLVPQRLAAARDAWQRAGGR